MSSRGERGCASGSGRRRMIGCGSGASLRAPLLWLAAAAVLATVAAATASTSLPASLAYSACRTMPPFGSLPLQPTDLWKFADASVSAPTDSCRFTIDAPPNSTVQGAATASSAAAAAVTPSYSLPSNASAMPTAPQLLVVRLISWHPGSECLREACGRNSSVPLRSDGGRCSVALSQSYSVGAGDSSRSVEALLVSGGGGGADSSQSYPASAASTIAWTDAALSASVSGSGCCGARLLLGYKYAPAQSACRSAAAITSTATSPPSSSSSSSDAPPYSSTPSSRQFSTPEFVDKYTYMFAQDRKLRWLPPYGSAYVATAAAACRDGEDYELIFQPAPSAEAASAEPRVQFDLLTAPTRHSCRRLCVADDCSPRLGAFNASGGQQLSVRYEYRSAAGSGGVCAEREYSGFTLRLLAPSRVQFAAFVSPPPDATVDSYKKQDLVIIIAAAAGAAVILIILVTVIAVLAARWRRRRSQPAVPNMEMRSREIYDKGQKPFLSAEAVDDNDRYAEVKYSEAGRRAASRDGAAENQYWKLGMVAEGAPAGAELAQEHEYCEFMN